MLRSKDEFFDVFKLWLPRAESSGDKLGCLRADGGEEFISIVLKDFCNERGIDIGYTALYMYEENSITERCWRTLSTMKDSLLIDGGLPLNFWVEAMDTSNYL